MNDAPAGTDNTVTTNEDTAYTFTAADFGFTDPNDTPANAFATVMITTLPGDGTLKLSGVNVAAGQAIAVADITAGHLVLPRRRCQRHALRLVHLPGQGRRRHDQRRRDTDQSANTMTVNVTAVNDAPVIS